jgi:hypothetical protein
MRPEAGIITGLLPTWTTTNTKGIFSLREAQQMLPQGQWARGPIAPTNLVITPQDTALALTWTAPATTHGTITNYLVEYTPSGGSTTAVLTGSTSAAYTITGLTNNVVHTVRVAAVNFTRGEYLTGTATPSGTTLPNAIAGLQLWYDAADATTLYNATSGGSLSGSDGDVLRIEDKSGNARHATAVSGHKLIRRLSAVNGKDALDTFFSAGSGYHLSLFNITNSSALSFLMQTTSTVFAVFRYGTISYSSPCVILGSGATTGHGNNQIGYTLGVEPTYTYTDKGNIVTVTRNRVRLYSRAILSTSDWRYNAVSADNSLAQDTWHIVTVAGDMNNATLANRGTVYKNGVDLTPTESGTLSHSTSNTTEFRLFGNYNGQIGGVEYKNMLNGKFAELIVYNSVLSNADRNGIIAYLSAKWGIA